MGASEFQTAYKDWAKRVAKYQQAGIPQTVWSPIAQNDLNKTYSQGAQPMTNAEADVAVFSAANQTSAIKQSPRHNSGIWGGIETVASNIVPDIGNIITGLPRGIAETAKSLVDPSTYTSTAQDLSAAMKDVGAGQYGQGIRDIDQSKLLSLIPGVADAADLTTGAGRKALEQHPVTAALDVLPITKPLSAGAGMLLEAGSEGGLEAGSAAAALRAGQPLKAGLIATDRSLGSAALGRTETGVRAAEQGIGPGQYVSQRLLARASLDSMNRNLSALVNHGNLAATDAAKYITKTEMQHIFEELGNDPIAIEAFTEKATLAEYNKMTPAELTVLDKVQAYRGIREQIHTDRGDLVKLDQGYFAKNSPVVKAHNTRTRIAENNTRIEARINTQLEQVSERIKTARLKRAKAIRSAQRYMQMHREGRGPDLEKIEKATKDLQSSNIELRNAMMQRQTLQSSLRDRRNLLKDANDTFQRKLIKNPPAHLHPLIIHNFRQRMQDAVDPNMVDPKGSGALMTIDAYNKVMKDMATTNMDVRSKFTDYVGKEESQKLWQDSVMEALKLDREGQGPVYMHHLPSMDGVLSAHDITKTRDVAESQVKQRALNFGSSVMNMAAAMTREAINTVERDGMQEVYEKGLKPHEQTEEQLMPIYRRAAGRAKAKGKYSSMTEEALATYFMKREWTEFKFKEYGIRRSSSTGGKADKIYIPSTLAHNLESFTKEGAASRLAGNKVYSRSMKVFRTSVLYGPRHFAHVVIGGIMPLAIGNPTAILEFPQLWDMFRSTLGDKPFSGMAADGTQIPKAIYASRVDYKTDAAMKMYDQKAGNKLGSLLKDFWDKTGAKPGIAMQRFENAAQQMYEGAVYLRSLKAGKDPVEALEKARSFVVNLDTLSPFERTIFKQVFPFYSFTRFATKFLVKLPFDHPLRVAILSQISNQAQEEWGTGLPQSMMNLFFIGSPDSKGDIETVNFRNMNPFRSISNMFTLGGFMSSLNPVIQGPLAAMGFNTLDGTSQMYPEIVYDAQTGDLTVARPKGDWMMAAEGFVPELGALDAYFGISDNLRSLRTEDRGAFDREIMNMFNLPFAPSQYNMPQTRARVAENAYKGSENALTAYKKTGNYDDTIGRYNLVPYQGQLVSPQDFSQYYQQLTASYGQEYSGAYAPAMIPKTTTPTTDTLAQLMSYYGQ